VAAYTSPVPALPSYGARPAYPTLPNSILVFQRVLVTAPDQVGFRTLP